MALKNLVVEQQEEHSDSVLLDRIMDTALESSGRKITDKMSMLNVLGSYDKVISKFKRRKVFVTMCFIEAESSKVPAA